MSLDTSYVFYSAASVSPPVLLIRVAYSAAPRHEAAAARVIGMHVGAAHDTRSGGPRN